MTKKEIVEEKKWLEETNKDILAEYNKKPKYLIRGLRSDSHYGYELQDTIEEIVIEDDKDSEGWLKRNLFSGEYKWKEVEVYKLTRKPCMRYTAEDIKKMKKTK